MNLLVALSALGAINTAHALCTLPSMSIESDLTISGCYVKTVYSGLYETTVYTIEGRDVVDTGTKAILASNVSFSSTTDCTCLKQEDPEEFGPVV